METLPAWAVVYCPSIRIRVSPELSLGIAWAKVFHALVGESPEEELFPVGDM
jgi:hypothetical protein